MTMTATMPQRAEAASALLEQVCVCVCVRECVAVSAAFPQWLRLKLT